MWRDLPFDLLANIFSFLSADSLACAASTCRLWKKCAKTHHPLASNSSSSWFMALPIRHHENLSCFAQNPTNRNWHLISLDFLPTPIRPLTSMGGLVFFRTTVPTNLHLLVCNPFTREFKKLPMLNTPRCNPAVGVIAPATGTAQDPSSPHFQVYVAGGMSEGSTYEPTLEVYDSKRDTWRIVGPLPMEFAVRLTVWTPNDSAYCDGVLYWITSARAYSLMGCDISSNSWRELRVPMAEWLEFAALVLRKGRLTVVGGTCGGGGASVWELGEGEKWVLVGKVPVEMGVKFVGEKESWARTKCVGCDGAIYLSRDVGSGMIAWKEVGESGEWEWFWVEGCSSSVRDKKVPNLQVKGVVLSPNLAHSRFFSDQK
ncbi:hypothetical protein TIFTF001_019209 [Ficus carica]|uniref:F-box domain-containing protein n=1 Tax=Ficus carica TaxID=3494 RepID=A0AA88DJD2_FICCA|nr:hypothetical protein TIFTF001_019209 [Ficus carica]